MGGASSSDEEGPPKGSVGLGNAAEAKYIAFRPGLSELGQCLADLLRGVHSGIFDAEFLRIAGAEMKQ